MIKKLIVFLFFNLLIYNSTKGQVNLHPKSEQDTLLFYELTEYDRAKKLIDSVLQSEKKEKDYILSRLIAKQQIQLNYFNLPLNRLIDYNSYEGFRLGFGLTTNKGISKYFSIGGYFSYGIKDEDWKYGGDLTLNLHKNSESKLHFSYSKDVQEKSGYNFLNKEDFRSSEAFRKFMIYTMDWVEKYEIAFSFLSFRDLNTNVFFNQSEIKPTDNYRFAKDLLNSTNIFTFNEIGIQIGYLNSSQTSRLFPLLYLNLTKGLNWIDGEYNYTKYEAKITKSFNPKSLGKTNLTLVGGLANGDIPLSKLYNGHGSYQSFSIEAENSFGTMRMGEFYCDRFFSVFFKHEFEKSLIQSEIFAPKLALIHNYGIGSLQHKEYHKTAIPLQSFDKGYYEAGLLISDILKPAFIGFGFGLFYRYGPYSFLKTADNFAYKLSLTFEL